MTTIDPARVRRALSLDVLESTDGQFIVTGGAAAHTVRHDGNGWACDCADSRFNRERTCKHRLDQLPISTTRRSRLRRTPRGHEGR